jgi:hypothetical protein
MEIEILPGVVITVDPTKYTVENALRVTPNAEAGADIKISLDATIITVGEDNASKVQGIVALRSV